MSQQYLPKNIIIYIFNFVQKGENLQYKSKKYFKKRRTEKYRRRQYLLNYLCISKKYLPDLLNLLNQRVMNGTLNYPDNVIANSNKKLYEMYYFKSAYCVYNFSIKNIKLNSNYIELYFKYNYYKQIINEFEKTEDLDFEIILYQSIRCSQVEIFEWIISNKDIEFRKTLAGKVSKFISKNELKIFFVYDANYEYEMFKMDMKMFNFIIESNLATITEILLGCLSYEKNYLIIDYILFNLMDKIDFSKSKKIYHALTYQNHRYYRFLPVFDS